MFASSPAFSFTHKTRITPAMMAAKMAENNPGPMAYHPINNSVSNAKGVTFG